MTMLTKEHFDEAIKNMVTKQDLEKIESAVRNATLLAVSAADDLRRFSEQLADVQEALEWNTIEVGALSDKSVPADLESAFK
jgi:hypothetical protein